MATGRIVDEISSAFHFFSHRQLTIFNQQFSTIELNRQEKRDVDKRNKFFIFTTLGKLLACSKFTKKMTVI